MWLESGVGVFRGRGGKSAFTDGRPPTHTQHLSMLYNVGRCVTVVGKSHGRVQRRRRASACDFPVLDPRPPGPASSRVAGGRRVPRTEAVCAPWVLTPRDPQARPAPAAASSLPASSRSSVAASSRSSREGSVPSSPARIGRPPAGMSTAVGSRPRRRSTGRDIETGASARRVPTGMGPDRPNTPDCGTPCRGGAAGSRTVPRVPLVGASPGPGNMDIWKSAIGSPVYRQGMSRARGEPAGGSRGGRVVLIRAGAMNPDGQ